MTATLLCDFARDYAAIRGCCLEYTRTLCRRALALCRHVGDPTLAALSEGNVNSFLASLVQCNPWTIRSYRSDILVLWRAAADRDLLPYPIPRRIRRTKCPELVIDCYRIEEVRRMLDAAAAMPGALANGVPKRHYWPAAIRVAWDSALRRSDVWGLRYDRVQPDGSLTLSQSKTGRRITVRLYPSTVAALDRIGGATPLAWTMNQWSFGLQFKQIATNAGVNRGSFKFLRRASGSYVDWIAPGAGSKHLGHRSPDVFDRHYRVELGGEAPPRPPEL